MGFFGVFVFSALCWGGETLHRINLSIQKPALDNMLPLRKIVREAQGMSGFDASVLCPKTIQLTQHTNA